MDRRVLRIVAGIVGAVIVLLPFMLQAQFTPAWNKTLSQAVYFAIAAMGLNLLTGFNGQVSIGHGAFFGVGAFTTAILMDSHGWQFEATIPVAAVIAAVLGVLVGIPALRVKGLYLALVTLGLAVLFPRVVQKYVEGSGGTPIVRPPRSEFGSLVTFLEDDQWKYAESLVIAAVLFVLAWALTRSRFGRAMVAVRDQETAASTLGVNIALVKVDTFAISAAYAGVAGSLSVMIEGSAAASDPTIAFRNSIEFLVAVVIGGTATIAGPAIGAFVLILLREESKGWVEGKEVLAPALFGALLIAMVFVLPGGVVGGLRSLADKLFPAKGGGRTPVASAALAPDAVAADVDADLSPDPDPDPPSLTKENP